MNSANERKILIIGTPRDCGKSMYYYNMWVRNALLDSNMQDFTDYNLFDVNEIRPRGSPFMVYDEYGAEPVIGDSVYQLKELIKQVEKLAIKNPKRTEYKLQLINLRKKLKNA